MALLGQQTTTLPNLPLRAPVTTSSGTISKPWLAVLQALGTVSTTVAAAATAVAAIVATNFAATVAWATLVASQLLSDFMGDHLSVMMFGAGGQGLTDDSNAINAAIAYAISTGRALYVPAGVYLCNTVTAGAILNILAPSNNNYQSSTVPYGLTMIGDGSGKTFIVTTTAGADLMAAISTVSAYPVYKIEGLQLVGPDGAHAGAGSGNGLRISGTASPGVVLRDVYARNFFGVGSAAVWLDNCEEFLVEHVRTDLSDIGLLMSGAYAGKIVNHNASQCYTDGFQSRGATEIKYDGTVQSTQTNGVTLYGAVNCAFFGLHLENNNIGGGGWALGLIGGSTYGQVHSNQFYGLGNYSPSQSIYLSGTSADVVYNNHFYGGNRAAWGGSSTSINIANEYAIGNIWYGFNPNWFAGYVGAEKLVGSSGINAFVIYAAAGAVAISGPCGDVLYGTQNTALLPGIIANLPATYGGIGGVLGPDGQRCSVFIQDAYTTFVSGGNIEMPVGISSPFAAEEETIYEFICINGTWRFLNAPNVATALTNTTGTFMPTVTFATSTGTITYILQSGTYSQTGVQVIASLVLEISGIGTSVGTLSINGLPTPGENCNAPVFGQGFLTTLSGLVGTMSSGAGSFNIYIDSGQSNQVAASNFGLGTVVFRATFAYHV